MKFQQPEDSNAPHVCRRGRSLHHRLVIGLIFCGSLLFQSAAAQPFAGSAEFVPGELIVQFKSGAADSQVLDAFQRAQMDVKRAILTPAMEREGHPGIDVVTTRLPVAQALRILSNHPAVAFAEPNWIYRRQAGANDTYYGSLWNLHGTYGINAPAAWDITTGSPGVAVGVVDQGFDPGHPDLASNTWLNPGDPTVNGVNEDDNWYWYTYLFFPITVRVDCTDDTQGWDFLNQNHTVYDSWDSPTDLSDGDDHGSHVAGIIGAAGNNSIGVVGVNWDVTTIASKFIGGGFGTLEDAIDALDYVTNLKTRAVNPVNIVAANASWGGGGYSQAMHDAIIRMANAEILLVAAAGNGGDDQVGDNIDVNAFYPAAYDTSVGTSTQAAAAYNGVIAVAAIDSSGQTPPWTNYGADRVHLGAPGVAILSTVPEDMEGFYGSPAGYATFSGTSMAAPHVTGAAALYASANPGATAEQIRAAILSSTAPTASLAGKTATGGRLDVAAMLGSAPAPTPPPAPAGLTAEAGDGEVVLSWTASAGATSYTVKRSESSGGPYETTVPGIASTNYTDTSVVNGVTYYYIVTASNTNGESGASEEIDATPQAPASTMHVGSITVSTINEGKGQKRGRAEITIVDSSGNPVAGADVYGSFSGALSNPGFATTNASGVAVIDTTDSAKGKVSVTFCVTDVSGTALTYDALSNVEGCDSN